MGNISIVMPILKTKFKINSKKEELKCNKIIYMLSFF